MQAPRIALLIDFDNVILGVEDPPGFDIELVVNALRSRGVVVLGRAYGDWYRHHRHRRKLMDHGIELVETPAFGPIIKNSADIRIALDGFEIGMTQHHITEICLVSGDSDFLPLIKRLQYLGKTVSVISGVKFTSELVRRNCNEFISYENLLADSVGATEDATVLDGAFALLVRTIGTLHDRGMEVRSSTVKQMMIQLNPVFSERTFGCAQFKQFLDKACRAGKIKLGTRDPNSGEYNVLLPGDLSDDNAETATPATDETEKAARSSRRTRGRRVQNAGEDLTLEPIAPETEATTEETTEAPASTPETEDARESTERESAERENAGREISAREALRQGRLRSSGRTWKGTATTRSVLQGAVNGAAQVGSTPDTTSASDTAQHSGDAEASAPSATETAKAAEELVEQDGGVVAEAQTEAKPEEKLPEEKPEEKPKRSSRHRRKSAEAKSDEPKSDETKTGETKVDEPKTEESNSQEAKPASKTAAKKSRSRKSAAAKSGHEAGSTPDAQTAPESSGDAEPAEEKKAAKKPVRRRTPRKKAEEPNAEHAE
jgi:uncharacterized protein (TIGR00288 family)